MIRRTAIVTGASSGIGLALAKALLKRDYAVVANGRSIRNLPELSGLSNCVLVTGDVAQAATGEALVSAALAFDGRVDLVVNNAGIFIPSAFTEYTEAQYRAVMGTNADGFFYTTQPAVRVMERQRSGHVVSISTTLAAQPVEGVNAFATSFSKGAINAATRGLAIEYAGRGIRFNAVGAGIIDTPMHSPDNHEFLRGLHPMARLGTIEEIVEAVLYLESAHFVTGEVLNVDGGAHAGKWR